MTTLWRLWYRWQTDAVLGRWSGWVLGARGESEVHLIDYQDHFVSQFPDLALEFVIQPEGEQPEQPGGIPMHWLRPEGWW